MIPSLPLEAKGLRLSRGRREHLIKAGLAVLDSEEVADLLVFGDLDSKWTAR